MTKVPAAPRQTVLDIREEDRVICDGRAHDQGAAIDRAFEIARDNRLELTAGGLLYAEKTIDARGVSCPWGQMPILTVPLDQASPSKSSQSIKLPPWYTPDMEGVSTYALSLPRQKPVPLGIVVEAGRLNDSLHCLEQTFVVLGDGSADLSRMPTCIGVRVKDDPSTTTKVRVFGGYRRIGLLIADNTESGSFETCAKADDWAAWMHHSIDAKGKAVSPDGVELIIRDRGCRSSYGECNGFDGTVAVTIWNEARAAFTPIGQARYLVRNGKHTLIIFRSRGGFGEGLVAVKDDGSPIDTLILEGYFINGLDMLMRVNARHLKGRVMVGRWKGANPVMIEGSHPHFDLTIDSLT